MSSSRYIYNKLDVNMASFRYWQDKPREVLELLYYDTALGYYLAEGFTKEALKPGFDFVDKDGKEIHEDIDKKKQKNLMDIYIKARSARKWFGFSVLTHLARKDKTKDRDDNEKFWHWLEDTHIPEIEILKGTNQITKLIFRDPEEFPVTKSKVIEGAIPVEGDDLEDVRLLGKPQKEMGKFRSEFEPIVDNLISFANFHQELSIGVIRTYSGLRYVIAPASYLSDSKARKEIEDTLEAMGHNFLWAAPDGDDIMKGFKFGIKFGEGSPPFSPGEAEDAILTPIAIFSKIPKEALKGNEIGLRSAETNRQAFLNVLSEEQEDCNDDIMWMHEKEFDGVKFEEGDSIRWKPLVEVDEKEKVEVFKMKLESLQLGINIGVEHESLIRELDLEVTLDEAIMESNRLAREALSKQVSKGDTKDGKPSDGETDTKTPPKSETDSSA